MAKKLVTVFGATGLQGGSVVRALKDDTEFTIRAVTRNASGDKAKKLKQDGVAVCEADFDSPETLSSAVKDAYACFIVTNYWEHLDQQREINQGLAVLEACKNAGVKHIVFSGLESCKDLAGITVQHFDGKAIVEDKIKESGLPYTIVRTAAYYENFRSMFANRAQGETFGIGVPMGDKPLGLFQVEELGGCVRSVLKEPAKYMGKTLGLASDMVTVDQIVDTYNKTFGPSKNFINFNVTPEAFAKFGFPGAEDIANMFKFYQTDKFERDVALTKKLNPHMLSFEDWVAQNKKAIEEAMDSQPQK